MINGNRVLALIPARGGSKGIKDKNIRDLNGKPLIAYTIEAALKSEVIDTVVVTTDSKAIAEVAKEFGAKVPFMRPKEYAQDKSTTLSAVVHAINELSKMGDEYDVLVLLQPTSPLRDSIDIKEAVKRFAQNEMKALASVSRVENHPLLIRSISEENRLESLLRQNSTIRRQDMPDYYVINGAIYINKISEINEETSFNDNKIPYIMSKEHSVDIDEMTDLLYAEMLMGNLSRNA